MADPVTWKSKFDLVRRAYQAMCEIRDSRHIVEHSVLRLWKSYLRLLKEKTTELWQDSRSWEFQMCELSRWYVCGSLPYHPSFEEPVWPETEAILPGLVSLHEFGLLTTYSEPGHFGIEQDIGVVTKVRKRPHLFFMLPTKSTIVGKAAIQNFMYGLEKSNTIWYHVKYHYSSDYFPATSSRVFPKFSGQFATNIPERDPKKFVCEQTLDNIAEWEDQSYQYIPDPQHRHRLGTGGLNDYDYPFQASLAVDPFQICIISRNFTTPDNFSDDLQTLVVELLEAAGFQRLAQPQHHSESKDEESAVAIASSPDEAKESAASEALSILARWAEEAQNKELVDGVELGGADEGDGDDLDTGASSDDISSVYEDTDDGESDGTLMNVTEDQAGVEDSDGTVMDESNDETEDGRDHAGGPAPYATPQTSDIGSGSSTNQNLPGANRDPITLPAAAATLSSFSFSGIPVSSPALDAGNSVPSRIE